MCVRENSVKVQNKMMSTAQEKVVEVFFPEQKQLTSCFFPLGE